ncbi:unnamed protein product, partial [Rotaria socialis]
MDWSDEVSDELEDSCYFKSAAMECDEHLCPTKLYSCGDGHCIHWVTRMAFQRSQPSLADCF